VNWFEKYYLPLSEKDRFVLQLKDPELIDFADFLTFADTRKEVYVRRESDKIYLAVFDVKSGVYYYRYRKVNEEDSLLPELSNKFAYRSVSVEKKQTKGGI
jgi:hypothetical protein